MQGKGSIVLGLAIAIQSYGVAQAIDEQQFVAETLPVKLTVGYAVRAVDVNADSKLDIAIVDSKRIVWLEAPKWTEHVIYETPDAKADNVCFAPHDINQDGLIDFALGSDWQPNNTASGGKIGWLEHTSDGPWRYHQIAQEPTTHRMNWFRTNANDPLRLIVAPLKGKGTKEPGFDQSGVRLTAYEPIAENGEVQWRSELILDKLPVMHNFQAFDLDDDGNTELVTASFDGVSMLKVGASEAVIHGIGSGQETAAPAKGSSEIATGRLADKSLYIATIEPWHGDKVVVYRPGKEWQKKSELWNRSVIDDQLAWGHAVSCANLNDDTQQELIVGVRDNQSETHRCGVRIYDVDESSPTDWKRILLDAGGVAVEDLTCADFDGDGDIDIVAVGRATHNAKVYWNQQVVK